MTESAVSRVQSMLLSLVWLDLKIMGNSIRLVAPIPPQRVNQQIFENEMKEFEVKEDQPTSTNTSIAAVLPTAIWVGVGGADDSTAKPKMYSFTPYFAYSIFF